MTRRLLLQSSPFCGPGSIVTLVDVSLWPVRPPEAYIFEAAVAWMAIVLTSEVALSLGALSNRYTPGGAAQVCRSYGDQVQKYRLHTGTFPDIAAPAATVATQTPSRQAVHAVSESTA